MNLMINHRTSKTTGNDKGCCISENESDNKRRSNFEIITLQARKFRRRYINNCILSYLNFSEMSVDSFCYFYLCKSELY